MRSLFRYLLKNHSFFLFFFLEIIALFFVFNFNQYQKVKYLNSAGKITGSVYHSFNTVVGYFGLSRINREVAEENARLRSYLQTDPENELNSGIKNFTFIPTDSTLFHFVSARVINNSVNRPFNYITLNKGRKDGIKPDLGIISASGIVGVVTHVTDSYSVGLSVLNQRWGVSAKIRKSGFLGSLYWDGMDYRYASLMEIPFHVELERGDTIVTSGYSAIFPEGIIIGTIHSFDQPQGENYYNVSVKLATNFKALSYVEVVENQNKEEIEKLENLIRDNAGTN